MASAKEKPLTELQLNALRQAEDTLYGDVKLIPGYGRSTPGLRAKGLIEGAKPHIYLTDAGKAKRKELLQ